MTWGWDWDHQSYSRERSGFLGFRHSQISSCLGKKPYKTIAQPHWDVTKLPSLKDTETLLILTGNFFLYIWHLDEEHIPWSFSPLDFSVKKKGKKSLPMLAFRLLFFASFRLYHPHITPSVHALVFGLRVGPPTSSAPRHIALPWRYGLDRLPKHNASLRWVSLASNIQPPLQLGGSSH